MCLNWGSNLQPRCVPWLDIQLATFLCMGQHATRHTSQGSEPFISVTATLQWMELCLDYHFSNLHVLVNLSIYWNADPSSVGLEHYLRVYFKSSKNSAAADGQTTFEWQWPRHWHMNSSSLITLCWKTTFSNVHIDSVLCDKTVQSIQPHITCYTHYIL